MFDFVLTIQILVFEGFFKMHIKFAIHHTRSLPMRGIRKVKVRQVDQSSFCFWSLCSVSITECINDDLLLLLLIYC